MTELKDTEASAEVGHPITNMLMQQAAEAGQAGQGAVSQTNEKCAVNDLDKIEAEFVSAIEAAMRLAVKLQQALKEAPDGEAREDRISAKLDQLYTFHLEA